MPRVRFLPDNIEVNVSVGASILEAARECGATVGSACGGVCACSTCHVYVREGDTALSPIGDNEEDILDKAFDVRAQSRLGCQGKLLQDRLYVVEITRESRKAFFDEHPDLRGNG